MGSFKSIICLVVKTAILPIMVCFILCKKVNAQNEFQFKYPTKRQEISFKKIRGLLIVTAFINHKGPFNLILDTGVGLFLITDPSLLDSLNIENKRKIKITGLGEQKDIEAYITPSLLVEIGNTVSPQLPAAILDRDVFDLSAFAGIPIHGLIGYDFFKSFTAHIFYETGLIDLYLHGKGKIPKKYSKIPITIESNKPYLMVNAEGNINKKYILKMLIDTGAGNALSLETYENQPFPLPDKNISANLGVGLNGDINGFIGRLKSISLGKYILKEPICAFPRFDDVASKTLGIARNGSIGNLLMKRFNVIYDYDKGFIYLKPNLNFNLPFEHDMSGMELFAGGESFNRIIVNRVEKNSPADEIGIQKNDELITINFKKVKDMSMEDIISLFHSQDKKNFYVEFNHSDVLKNGILTLKRRI
jgi:hypothetical protein